MSTIIKAKLEVKLTDKNVLEKVRNFLSQHGYTITNYYTDFYGNKIPIEDGFGVEISDYSFGIVKEGDEYVIKGDSMRLRSHLKEAVKLVGNLYASFIFEDVLQSEGWMVNRRLVDGNLILEAESF
jgi:uncharacterized protein with ACT and thioredoxin-like domain